MMLWEIILSNDNLLLLHKQMRNQHMKKFYPNLNFLPLKDLSLTILATLDFKILIFCFLSNIS